MKCISEYSFVFPSVNYEFQIKIKEGINNGKTETYILDFNVINFGVQISFY